jgi:hypothetical protein
MILLSYKLFNLFFKLDKNISPIIFLRTENKFWTSYYKIFFPIKLNEILSHLFRIIIYMLWEAMQNL